MQTFAISDLHLDDEDIRKDFRCRTWDTFYRFIERKWNSKVRKRDRVIVLGDVTDTIAGMEILKKLNGVKWLILRNHDIHPHATYLHYFEYVGGSMVFENYLLTHIPVHPKVLEGCVGVNIHGHIFTRKEIGPNYINVTASFINYQPVLIN